MFEELQEKSKEIDLTINMTKTKIMYIYIIKYKRYVRLDECSMES